MAKAKRPAVAVTFDDLSDEVIVCREQGHAWGRNYRRFWLKARKGVIIEERREWDCGDCGSIRVKVYEISGGKWWPKSSTIQYPKDKPYLLKGAGAPMRAPDVLAAVFRRQFPKERLG